MAMTAEELIFLKLTTKKVKNFELKLQIKYELLPVAIKIKSFDFSNIGAAIISLNVYINEKL